jgi:hypothetical protein
MTPVVAVNGDGVVGVAWYDRREDPTRRCWKKYFAASLDGGETFTPNVPLSSAPSCPSEDMAPTIHVKNATPDSALAPQDSVEALVKAQKWNEADAINVAILRREAEAEIDGTRLRVSFDRGRSVWPGHYTGLAAGSSGAFHALWADRRSGSQQLYSAKVEVATGPEAAAPTLQEADVTHLIEVVAGQAEFDEASGISTVEFQLRNASDRTVYGPLQLRVKRVVTGSAAGVILDASNGQEGAGAVWDFSGLLGSQGRLGPKEVSEAHTVKIRSRPEDGLDVAFEFEVLGRIAQED